MHGLRDLHGKVALVTGCTNGIGQVTARALGAAGAHVVLVARNAEKAAAEQQAIETAGGSAEVILADLLLQSQVREAVRTFRASHDRLDILVANAGALFLDRRLTDEGIERTWALNHLSCFLLVSLLLDVLKASAPARVVIVSSDAHRGAHIQWEDPELERGWSGWRAYGQSKLANALFARELGKRLQGTGVAANAVHPGFVASGFAKNNGWLATIAMTLARPFARNTERGADSLIWLAAHPDAEGITGEYVADRKVRQPAAQARDDEAAARLWALSERSCGLVAPEGAAAE